MQGWSPDFIPALTRDALAANHVDRVLAIAGADALRCARDLAQQEGILAGITAGATLAGALQLAASAPDGTTILCMLPDTGERYLSTPLFADIPIDMTADELAIARSTPNYRFDVSTPPPPPTAPAPAVAIDPDAAAFVDQVVKDHPVVLFAFEWCEYCWAVRKLFAAYKIPYLSVDLDSVKYQADNRGTHVRAALGVKAAAPTIPQIFVGGELVGGCTDVMHACRDGALQQRLARCNVSYDTTLRADPFSFLPNWRHS